MNYLGYQIQYTIPVFGENRRASSFHSHRFNTAGEALDYVRVMDHRFYNDIHIVRIIDGNVKRIFPRR